jgi:Ser/Thr protein kinase RdoA (MazF antagonist)
MPVGVDHQQVCFRQVPAVRQVDKVDSLAAVDPRQHRQQVRSRPTATRITLPPVARDWRESRYDRYANGTEGLFAGGTLLHGDINPDNLLTGPDGDITIVDWSWPTHGAAFIDPACLVVQLIAAGHTPAQAEDWAARCTAWREADPAAIDAFAAATVRMYQRFEQLAPEPWRKAMTAAAASWAEHRGQAPARPRALAAQDTENPGRAGQ